MLDAASAIRQGPRESPPIEKLGPCSRTGFSHQKGPFLPSARNAGAKYIKRTQKDMSIPPLLRGNSKQVINSRTRWET